MWTVVGARRKQVVHSSAAECPSIGLPADVYKALDGLGKEEGVLLAWVMREPAERDLTQKWPLFTGQG